MNPTRSTGTTEAISRMSAARAASPRSRCRTSVLARGSWTREMRAASDDRPTLLVNETPAGNWLLLKLTNKQGCCTPIGARCEAIVGGKTLTRAVIGGGSYGGDSDYRVHFGLGAASEVAKLEIH